MYFGALKQRPQFFQWWSGQRCQCQLHYVCTYGGLVPTNQPQCHPKQKQKAAGRGDGALSKPAPAWLSSRPPHRRHDLRQRLCNSDHGHFLIRIPSLIADLRPTDATAR